MSVTAETENHRVAVHEAGHFLAASHFRIYADPQVFDKHEKRAASDGRILAGECRLSNGGTPFHNAVIGWAGILAEQIAGVGLNPSPFPLTRNTIREFHAALMCNFDKILSIADQQLICGYKPSFWTPFKAAYRILTRNKAKLRRLSSMLAKQTGDPMSPEPEFTLKFSPQDRAQLLEKHLAGLKPDDPSRMAYATALEHLKRGEEPPDEILSKSHAKLPVCEHVAIAILSDAFRSFPL